MEQVPPSQENNERIGLCNRPGPGPGVVAPAFGYNARRGGPSSGAGGSLMPIHDWTRVTAGIFHHFHQAWIMQIAQALNGGLLPPNYYALAEAIAGGIEPDVLTLEAPAPRPPSTATTALNGGVGLATRP